MMKMLKIIANTSFKCLLLLVLLSLVGSAFRALLPFAWGSKQLNSKLGYIAEEQLDPNVYFLGSSVSNRQIMPTSFDALVGDAELKSFNLSIDGTMPPHHFYLLEELMECDKTIDHIFMELDGFDHMPPRHFMTTFSKFYFSPRWYGWSMANLIFSNTIRFKQKLFMSYKYTRSFFENLFFVSMRYDALKSLSRKSSFSYKVLKRYKDGFMFFGTKFTENEVQSRDKQKILDETIETFNTAYKKLPERLESNFIYKYLLRKYLKKAAAKGIQLYYIISPRQSVLLSAEELLDIKYSLPADRVIDLADPEAYPQLYKSEWRYDADHLNEAGARNYTKLLAEQFELIINDQK